MPLRIPPNASSTTWTNVPVSAPYVHNRMRSQSSTASSANIAAVQIQTAGQRRSVPIRPRSGRSAAPSAARHIVSALPAEFGDPHSEPPNGPARELDQIGIVTDPQRAVALVARVDRHDDFVANGTG